MGLKIDVVLMVECLKGSSDRKDHFEDINLFY